MHDMDLMYLYSCAATFFVVLLLKYWAVSDACEHKAVSKLDAATLERSELRLLDLPSELTFLILSMIGNEDLVQVVETCMTLEACAVDAGTSSIRLITHGL